MKMKIIILLILTSINITAQQSTVNQNGLQSTVINGIRANGTQAKRYEIAKVLYNSHHWQNSSLIAVELFNVYFASGYEKFIIELGSAQGTSNSLPKITRVDSEGINHNAKVSLGEPIIHSTSQGEYPNKIVSIYVDVRHYSYYSAKITHLRNRVTLLNNKDQILINETPSYTDISDFTLPVFIKENSLWDLNSNNVSYIQGNVGIGTTNPVNRLHIYDNKAGYAPLVIENDNANGLGLLVKAGDRSTYVADFRKADNTNLVRIDGSGNVGIGTIDTGSHKLAVEGSIGAREIKVEANGWSDFVFENDYNLPSLKEVEKHIKKKGHLKDIPSAKDVEENGIFLGEMDAKLLQKIEELTLYTIEQEKKIKVLEKESIKIETQNTKLGKQQKEIDELKTLLKRLLKKEK